MNYDAMLLYYDKTQGRRLQRKNAHVWRTLCGICFFGFAVLSVWSLAFQKDKMELH